MQPTKFEKWIDELGAARIARALKVTPATVRHWRRWYCDPRADQIRMIKKLSQGRLGYEDIIDRKNPTRRTRQTAMRKPGEK